MTVNIDCEGCEPFDVSDLGNIGKATFVGEAGFKMCDDITVRMIRGLRGPEHVPLEIQEYNYIASLEDHVENGFITEEQARELLEDWYRLHDIEVGAGGGNG